MQIDSAFTTGLQGYQRAEQRVDQASEAIASVSVARPEPEAAPVALTDELINLKLGELQAGASARVIQTASDMLGSLIDIRV
ncbi:flagellar hook-associated protein FlgK [Aeromonas sp. BIGb0405]|uniref:flagellar biosynthesis protein FlgE n=1 Tax=Aeromonas sp. BIGb0405 TaxID=2940592 RepID=UPI00216971FA|nr:flagellar biosynthesis protein FlgE [Aeromonas sp. BIGb0405]MCS3457139.1 flagellar hook-associated protein FlgK [Aeromonas sp. BIGb0405]